MTAAERYACFLGHVEHSGEAAIDRFVESDPNAIGVIAEKDFAVMGAVSAKASLPVCLERFWFADANRSWRGRSRTTTTSRGARDPSACARKSSIAASRPGAAPSRLKTPQPRPDSANAESLPPGSRTC